MEILFAALVVAAVIYCVPQVLADAWAMVKAANDGKWEFVQADRERRSAARQRWIDAWGKRRAARSLNAGGDGTWRPGMGAYAKDLYYDFWQRRLEKAQERRAAREADPAAPRRASWAERFADAVDEVVAEQARKWRRRFGWGRRGGDDPVDDFDDDEDTDYKTWRPEYDDEAPTGESDEGPRDRPDYDEEFSTGRREPDEARRPMPQPRPRPEPDPQPQPDEPDGQEAADDTASESSDQPDNVRHLPPRAEDTTTTAPSTTQGVPVSTDVLVNDDVRTNAATIAGCAAEMQEALATYEDARARAIAAQAASADGMSAKAFDGGATAANADAGDSLDIAALSHLAQAADAVLASAKAIHGHLDGWRDEEDKISQAGIDASTLAATSS